MSSVFQIRVRDSRKFVFDRRKSNRVKKKIIKFPANFVHKVNIIACGANL